VVPASDKDKLTTGIALATTLGGLAVALVLIALSDGFYQDDDITHFNFARDAWPRPPASQDAYVRKCTMWGVWARPGYNLPTIVAAHYGGVIGCRLLSAALTTIVAWLAYCIARRVMPEGGVALGFAPALVWLGPVTMTLACTTLTETPAALYMTLGVWLYLCGRRVLACAVLSLLTVTRYETLGLLPIIGAVGIADAFSAAGGDWRRALRKWWLWASCVALLWAPAAYVGIAAAINLPAEMSPLSMFSRTYTGEYGNGSLLHYIARWVEACGVGAVALFAAGVVHVGRRGVLPAALTIGLVILHTLIYRFGMFASGGYARFLVPAAGLVGAMGAVGLAGVWRGHERGPIVAICAAAIAGSMATIWTFWQVPYVVRSFLVAAVIPLTVLAAAVAITRNTHNLPHLSKAVAGVAMAAAIVQAGFMVRPLRIDPQRGPLHAAVVRAVREVSRPPYAGRPAMTCHCLVRMLREDCKGSYTISHALEEWKLAEPGTLFIWENNYGAREGSRQETRLYDALVRLGRSVFCERIGSAHVEVFERTGAEPVTAAQRITE